MVYLCGSLAVASPRVIAEIYEGSAFPELIRRYHVSATPRVILDGADLPGPYTAPALLAALARPRPAP